MTITADPLLMGKKITDNNGSGTTVNIFNNDFNPVFPSSFGTSANPPTIKSADQSTSFNLSGMHGGHEIVVAVTVLRDIPAGTNVGIKHKWYNKFNTPIFIYNQTGTAPTGGWSWYFIYSFIGYANWEIDANSTGSSTSTRCEQIMFNDISTTLNETKTFDVTNATSQINSNQAGNIWIDDTDEKIHYTDFWGWEHSIPIKSSSTQTSQDGHIWLDSSDYDSLYYTVNNKKILSREAELEDQLTPTTGTAGYMWIHDTGATNPLHGNYLSFIGNDGKRYIISDGDK